MYSVWFRTMNVQVYEKLCYYDVHFTDHVSASLSVLNDTAISLQWRTPMSVEQQGVTVYQVSVASECFTDVEEGQPQNFIVPANSSLHITAGSLGKCRSIGGGNMGAVGACPHSFAATGAFTPFKIQLKIQYTECTATTILQWF